MKTIQALSLALLAPALIGLTACAIEEEDFPDIYGVAICDQFEDCEPDDFASVYDDQDDCADDWAGLAELAMDAADLLGKTYDPDKGRDCIQEIRRADCDTFSTNDLTCDIYE